MYCSSCGTQMADTLSYCNHCGADLRATRSFDESKSSEARIDTVMWVIVGTTITILGMSLGALVLMKDRAIDFALGTVFVILSFVAFVLVEGLLVWRLAQLNKRAKGSRDLTHPSGSDAQEQAAARTRALREPPETMSTVTEETTRVFEASYGEDERR